MADFEGPWRNPPPPPTAPKKRLRWGFILWLALLALSAGAFFLLAHFFPAELSGLDQFQAVRLFALLALVSSGLVAARRVNLGKTARNIAGWAAIFAVVLVGYTFRDDLSSAGLKLRSALLPGYAVADTPRSMVVGRGDGDAFYVMGQVDGAPVRFLIDTGATDIVLSPADARRIGLPLAAMTFSRPSETANGVGYGAAVTVKSLAVGPIRLTDVPVEINQAPMATSLLGMPFLKRLDSFEVRGDRLFLRGRG